MLTKIRVIRKEALFNPMLLKPVKNLTVPVGYHISNLYKSKLCFE